MRNVLWLGGGLLVVALATASCGGSSSETPWPVEPDTPAPGPLGESRRGAAVDDHREPVDAGQTVQPSQ
jgi:hypothetical protein